jgi:formylglycine-generating enzyme required for sulfatase activity
MTKIQWTAFYLVCLLTPAATAQVTFDWATIGNPGNAPDSSPQGSVGAVDYVFQISKFEVTNAQYAEFLNAVDPTGANSLGLYDSNMTTNAAGGGITFIRRAADGLKYLPQVGKENKPVIAVNYFDVMRFTNWLHNGQGQGSTETGAYIVADGISEVRSTQAKYHIPNENEWYKAAYHKNDGATGNYWIYPTSTDAVPFSDQPPGADAPDQSNTANFSEDDRIANGYNDGYAVTASDNFVVGPTYTTDVGAYWASSSPYGTFDQGGNVFEWTEGVPGSFRAMRGGNWVYGEGARALMGSFRLEQTSPFEFGVGSGFRVARRVPEPASAMLLAIGAACSLPIVAGLRKRIRMRNLIAHSLKVIGLR